MQKLFEDGSEANVYSTSIRQQKVAYKQRSYLPAIRNYWWKLKQLKSRSDAEYLGVWFRSKLFYY